MNFLKSFAFVSLTLIFFSCHENKNTEITYRLYSNLESDTLHFINDKQPFDTLFTVIDTSNKGNLGIK
jgi:hypothetical protein